MSKEVASALPGAAASSVVDGCRCYIQSWDADVREWWIG